MGVCLRLDYDLPVDVTLSTGNVGGPSAGLMFSLAIYDVLTPGELTGGKDIAGTGTMEDDGTVGPIGGIRQKVVGARRGRRRVLPRPGRELRRARRAPCPTACGSSGSRRSTRAGRRCRPSATGRGGSRCPTCG